jgi:hypothetical protein
MIKLDKSSTSCPEHLVPVLFKCTVCGCLIKKIEETNSYVFQSINKDILDGKVKICSQCYRLKEYRGVD